MPISSVDYKWPDGTFVVTLDNGLPYHVTQGDPLFAQAQRDGRNAPLEPDLPKAPPTREGVRAEALRRIDAIADTRRRDQLMQRALRLIMKVAIEGEPLSASDQAEIAAGQSVTDQIETIQTAEKALLAMDPIPADYTDAKWWTP